MAKNVSDIRGHLFFSVFLLVLLALPLQAQTAYRVGVEVLDYAPYASVVDGVYQGLDRDILDGFAEYAGIELEYVPLPYVRLVKALKAGTLDLQFPDDPAWLPGGGQSSQAYFSNPAVGYTDGASVLATRSEMTLEQVEHLGTIFGFTPVGYYPRIDAGLLQLSEQGHVQGLIDQALLGRVDGIYLSTTVVAHMLEQQGRSGELVFNTNLPYRQGFYRLSSINHPELIAAFNQFLLHQRDWVEAQHLRYGIKVTLPEADPLCIRVDCASEH